MAATTRPPHVLAPELHHEPAAIATEWEQLADAVGAAPFARPGWFVAWYDTFGHGHAEILAVRREGALVALLPLERRAGALRAAANWHTPLFAPLAADGEALAALCDALLEMRALRYDLTMLDVGDPIVAALRKRAPHSVERVVASQPFVDVSRSWTEYDEGRPRKHRKELRRLRRRLDEEGAVECEFTAGGDRLDALLDEGFAIEGSGWKADQGTAIASDPHVERFYRDVARWADGRGWLNLAFLRLDGRAIAFDLNIVALGCTYVLKGGFAHEYRRYAPGNLLTYEALARAFADDRIESYEFLGDADDYKLAWTDSVRPRVRVQAFRRTPGGIAELLAWTHGRRAAKFVLGTLRS